MSTFLSSIFRKKTFDGDSLLQTNLKRCLNVFDVTALAIGQMIGAGIYVLAGSVIHNIAGPSVMISFLLAGFAALLSAFSYAEFGARFPRAGSAYTYAYVSVGELWGFIIGWNVILEYLIGNAAIARAWSAYLDNLLGNWIENTIISSIGHLSKEKGGFFSTYPDVVAFLTICLASAIVATGSKSSSNINKFFVVLNLSVIAFVVVVGFTQADFGLWFGSNDKGVSRFIPFGLSGTLSGAGAVFFSFIGFEALATAGEEAKNPRRTIPIATFLSLGLVTTVYILMAAALTVMLPYDQIDPNASFAAAFQAKGLTYAMYIVSAGALLAIMNNQMTGAFALPRAVYAMADDGLLFSFLAKINNVTKIPLNSIILSTLINAVIALVFDLNALVDFLSLGTLMAYSFVSASVFLLRYQPESIKDGTESQLRVNVPYRSQLVSMLKQSTVAIAIIVFILGVVILALKVKLDPQLNFLGIIWLVVGTVITLCGLFFVLCHEENNIALTYKVPLVPYIPLLSLAINTCMMIYLNYLTWIRLIIWVAIGVLIYMTYGYRNSKEGKKDRVVPAKCPAVISVVEKTKL